ncbi:hypothetical protein DUNSADRAFT_6159 [Dunaliella salina]|uniref:Sigma 54 modulation/S30EA ribosomal protein C-terminal domain-containing protein n=1 Tax=Dunaliella salina TaxID=3046 RepID=A0ABQ7GNV8_DUNSA|nr:hypothetical protein DUNSADRAFT_6159 [Dunaliella salina]|eukprot:KAF5836282.1 hypothetical protein DUNSADRAFT_6159 [Dunaliella salina]
MLLSRSAVPCASSRSAAPPSSLANAAPVCSRRIVQSQGLHRCAHSLAPCNATPAFAPRPQSRNVDVMQKVDVTVYTYRNGVVRVEDGEATLYAAIDVVCDKLSRKMTKIKEKAIAKGKWPGRAADKSIAKEEEEEEYNEYLSEVMYETAVFDREERLRQELEQLNKTFPSTVRRFKVLELDPVSLDDAIDEMEQVGHDFFVYRDLESDQIQVVYRRAEEGYGIIIPKKRD